jgi:P-type conjugative transfer protein TrbJ
MESNMRKNVFVIALAAFSLFGRPAAAQGIPVLDEAAIVEWAAQLEAMAAQYGVSVDQLLEAQKITQSLQKQLESSRNVDSASELQTLGSTLNQLRTSIGAGDWIGGSTQDTVSRLQKTFGSDFGTETELPDYVSIMKTEKDTHRGALLNSSSALDSLQTDASRINELANQSQNATGALEAQMAGNQINVEIAQQLVKLRQELATQGIAGNTAALADQQRQEARARVNVLFGGAPVAARGGK